MNRKCIRTISLIDDSILDYNEDTGLGGVNFRMEIRRFDVVDEVLFKDKNIKNMSIEIKLKDGHLSVNDLIEELFNIRCEYQIFRGELEQFVVFEEDIFNKTIYVEPYLGT